MNWYLKVLKEHYADFNGRARRQEYWMFVLFNAIIGWSLQGLALGLESSIFSGVSMIYSLAVLIPGIAVSVRRLHDVGKSGWFMFIVLIPLIGAIWLLILMCTDSDNGPNEYGDNPKGIGNDSGINQIGQE